MSFIFNAIIGQKERKMNWQVGLRGEGLCASFETRFKNPKWGYRIGLTYSYAQTIDMFFDNTNNLYAWNFPMDVNYLIGTQETAFEVGLGQNIMRYKEDSYELYEYIDENNIPQSGTKHHYEIGIGHYLYTNIGFRSTLGKNILYRIGLSPSFSFGGKLKKGVALGFYITVGKRF